MIEQILHLSALVFTFVAISVTLIKAKIDSKKLK